MNDCKIINYGCTRSLFIISLAGKGGREERRENKVREGEREWRGKERLSP